MLEDWSRLRSRVSGHYPELLYQLLFGHEVPQPGACISVQINAAEQLVTVDELLQSAPEPSAALTPSFDWLQLFPWETMLWHCWGAQRDSRSFAEWLTSAEGVSLVRSFWQSSAQPVDATPAESGRLSVLVAWVQPDGQDQLHGPIQLPSIAAMVEQLEREGLPLKLVGPLRNPTLDELCNAIGDSAEPLLIVHLIAHGDVGPDGVGRLLFRGADGLAVQEHAGPIVAALERHHKRWKLLPALFVLNACLSDSAASGRIDETLARRIAGSGVPYVLANQAAIKIHEMILFTEAFYRALSQRAPVDRAVLAGRAALAGQVEASTQPHEAPIPTKRTLPPLFSPETWRRLLGLTDGLPGWAVPVLYMAHGSDGAFEAWRPYSRIVWPTDGKVMVFVPDIGAGFYIDECPVTEEQYGRARQSELPPANVNSLASARAADNGLPVVNISPEQAVAYCAGMYKRLPNLVQWQRLVGYGMEAGLFSSSGELLVDRAAWGCPSPLDALNVPTRPVRSGGAQLNMPLYDTHGRSYHLSMWEVVGNVYEIVMSPTSPQRFYQVSSSFTEPKLFAYRRRVDAIPLEASVGHPQRGFRTVATWDDIDRVTRLVGFPPRPLPEP